jgi:hypothetical protein
MTHTETRLPGALDEFKVRHVGVGVLDDGFVQPGWQDVDRITALMSCACSRSALAE